MSAAGGLNGLRGLVFWGLIGVAVLCSVAVVVLLALVIWTAGAPERPERDG